MRLALAFTFAMFSGAASAQGVLQNSWATVEGRTSASLAAAGWHIVDSAGLSLPTGGQAVVSFWERNMYGTVDVMRCITVFDADFNQLSDSCAQAVRAIAQP